MKIFYLILIPILMYSQNPEINDSLNSKIEHEENLYSFGILYIPYFAGEYFYYVNDPYYGYRTIYLIGPIESAFESQFSYLIINFYGNFVYKFDFRPGHHIRNKESVPSIGRLIIRCGHSYSRSC